MDRKPTPEKPDRGGCSDSGTHGRVDASRERRVAKPTKAAYDQPGRKWVASYACCRCCPERVVGIRMTAIYVDADACPVREEVYRVAIRLHVAVHVVSNGSRPIRGPGLSNVQMVVVSARADAADDWIAERISAA